MPRQLRPLVNDNGDNEMIPVSPGICLTSEENPGKSRLGGRNTIFPNVEFCYSNVVVIYSCTLMKQITILSDSKAYRPEHSVVI